MSAYTHSALGVPGIAAALLATTVGATPALAGGSFADEGIPVVLTQMVRDTETGVRAHVRYFNDVMTGGMELYTDDQGVEHELLWDGWKGVFEVDFAPAGRTPADPESFVRDAVLAVCPSVDTDGLQTAPVEAVSATLFRIDAQCPIADAGAEQ